MHGPDLHFFFTSFFFALFDLTFFRVLFALAFSGQVHEQDISVLTEASGYAVSSRCIGRRGSV